MANKIGVDFMNFIFFCKIFYNISVLVRTGSNPVYINQACSSHCKYFIFKQGGRGHWALIPNLIKGGGAQK